MLPRFRSCAALLIAAGGLVLLGLYGLSAEEAAPEGPVQFSEHLILDHYGYAYGIAVADLDGDGHLDLTSSDTVNNNLYWFENDGKGNFRRHYIQKDEPGWFERHAIGDINGDGHPDVVVVKNMAGDVVWFENSGTPRDGRLWKRHVITKGGLPGAYDVVLADLDGDGHLDVAASSWTRGNQFVWFRNPGKAGLDKEWTKHVIEANVAETRTIRAADFNGDGKIDLLGTATGANLVVWYENPGKPATQPWKKHIIDDKSPRPVHGHAVDLDGDGDMDVVMALGFYGAAGQEGTHQVVWYENVGKPGDGTVWKKHVIGALPQAFEALAADINGDGHLDVVATAWGEKPGGRVVWFENPGDPRKVPWKMHVLKDNWPRANQVIVADFNGDKRLDIAAVAERGSNELRWWRNEGRAKK
jgi:hypothetical protein